MRGRPGMGGFGGGRPPHQPPPPIRRGWFRWPRRFWERGYGYRGCGCLTFIIIATFLLALALVVF